MSDNSADKQGRGSLYKKKAGERMFAGAGDKLFKRAAELRSHKRMQKKFFGITSEQNHLDLNSEDSIPFQIISLIFIAIN